jgi:hypothetical protein
LYVPYKARKGASRPGLPFRRKTFFEAFAPRFESLSCGIGC